MKENLGKLSPRLCFCCCINGWFRNKCYYHHCFLPLFFQTVSQEKYLLKPLTLLRLCVVLSSFNLQPPRKVPKTLEQKATGIATTLHRASMRPPRKGMSWSDLIWSDLIWSDLIFFNKQTNKQISRKFIIYSPASGAPVSRRIKRLLREVWTCQ